jgi:hypothetical protein
MKTVERWGIYELSLTADTSVKGNPFEASVRAVVTGPGISRRVDGFYAGGGVYKIRYMPGEVGEYTVAVRSDIPSLNGAADSFVTGPASLGNHGPAAVFGTRFRYADGAPLFIAGTTAYVWHHRPDVVRAQSLASFTRYGFNKIRMLFFPKHFTGGYGAIDVSYEPPCYPFEGVPCAFDFSRPNPAYFEAFEDRLRDLLARDIFADVILFHPYDFEHWAIDSGMDEDQALLYLKYLIARVACFRNVWWSLANEYDIKMLDNKRMVVGYDARDWDVIGEFIKARDPSGHPISCHNIPFGRIYPDRPWMTHVSYQHPDTYTLMGELLSAYKKPVIDDEYQYEGNTPDDWGNTSGEVELERHWRSVMAGGYATHGEAFIRGNNRDIFWAYGGDMIGESPRRIAYLREIIGAVPLDEMVRDLVNTDSHHYYSLRKGYDCYLIFIRDDLPGKHLWIGDKEHPREDDRYTAVTYDVWNCVQMRSEVVPVTGRIPLTKWTVVVLNKI